MALADFYGQGLLPIKKIAAKHDIPKQYLEQIFNQLGKANIIKSVRGQHGGYKLAHPPDKIMVSEIIILLEGGIEFAPENNDHTDAISNLFYLAENKLMEIFHVSLADLVFQQQRFKNVISYDI